jgi:putative peptidoglycan lipid II flippase
VLGGLTFLSRLAGLARDVVIGALFGASMGADAFFVAFRIPNLFRRVVAEGATSAAFVPVFSASLSEEGSERAVRAGGAVGAAAFVVLSVIVILGMVYSEAVVSLFAPGFSENPEKLALTVTLTRWTFPYLLFVGLAAWAMGLLHSFRRFAVPALGPILLNISIVVATTLLASRMVQPVYALVVGVLIGGFLQFAVQWPTLAGLGLRLRDLRLRRDPAIRRVGGLLVPTVFGGAVYQVNILVATVFASLLPDRSVSYLWYADRLFEFPLGIIAVAIGTAALPSFSAQASSGRLDEMASSVSYSLRLVWAISIPAVVGLWLLAPEVVSLLLERGQFTANDTAMTAWALKAYVVGMLGVASVRVLVSVFYAFERPRIPVIAAVVALVVNALADLALMGPTDANAPWWGAAYVASFGDAIRITDLRHAGLALGTSIAATVNAGILLVLTSRRLPDLRLAELAKSAAVHVVAAVAMGAVLIAYKASVGGQGGGLLYVLGAIGSGAAVYFLTAWMLGSAEIRDLTGIVTARFRG